MGSRHSNDAFGVSLFLDFRGVENEVLRPCNAFTTTTVTCGFVQLRRFLLCKAQCLHAIIALNSFKQSVFAMVKFCVFFAVRTEFLNIIQTSFGFEGLNPYRGTDGLHFSELFQFILCRLGF
jgi:hypothetical protein